MSYRDTAHLKTSKENHRARKRIAREMIQLNKHKKIRKLFVKVSKNSELIAHRLSFF